MCQVVEVEMLEEAAVLVLEAAVVEAALAQVEAAIFPSVWHLGLPS